MTISSVRDIPLSLPHQAARGVVEDGTDLYVDVPPPLQRLPQQEHHVPPLHTGTLEPLRPAGQPPHRQALLLHGETGNILRVNSLYCQTQPEREAQWEPPGLVPQISVGHKVRQTLGNVIKQLMAGTLHDLLRHGVHLGVHCELVGGVNVHHKNTKIGAPEVESQELAHLISFGEMSHVGWEALNRGPAVSLLAQSLLYGDTHPLFYHVDVVIVDDQVSAEIFQLPSLVGDDGRLVGVDEDAGVAFSSLETELPSVLVLLLKRVNSLPAGRVEHVLFLVVHFDDKICKYFII